MIANTRPSESNKHMTALGAHLQLITRIMTMNLENKKHRQFQNSQKLKDEQMT